MTQINERIAYLEKAIKTLHDYRRQKGDENIEHNMLLNIIINCAEYEEELEGLKRIRKQNATLFR